MESDPIDFFLDLSKIDLSQISASEFKGGVGTVAVIDTLYRSKDGFVYGKLTLRLHENNIVTSSPGFDEYDFEMHYPFLNNIKRNVATLIGRVVNYGEGQAFNINLHGEGRIGGN